MTRWKVLMQFTSATVPGSGHYVCTRRLSFWPLCDLQNISKHISSPSLINQQTGMDWQLYASLREVTNEPEVWVGCRKSACSGPGLNLNTTGPKSDKILWSGLRHIHTLSSKPWVGSNLLFGIKVHLVSCKFECGKTHCSHVFVKSRARQTWGQTTVPLVIATWPLSLALTSALTWELRVIAPVIILNNIALKE